MIELSGSFWIILTGILVAVSCALLGTFLVLRKMSLLGDAISHAVLPGIAVAYLFSGSRDILPMFLGALVAGLLTTFIIEYIHRHWRVQEDAAIGIVFTALFALGVIIISAYTGHIDLDQECVLYGEIAYTPWDTLIVAGQNYGPRPVWILGSVLLLNLLVLGLFYKEFKIVSFDPAMAMAIGINASLVHYILMALVSVTTVASFESVGAILVVAMLIVPGAAAYLWSDKLKTILKLSILFGVAGAVGGYYLAMAMDSSIAGSITTMLGLLFAVSLIVAPHNGLWSRYRQRRQLSNRIAADHILLGLIRHYEQSGEKGRPLQMITEDESHGNRVKMRVLDTLLKKGALTRQNGYISLTDKGIELASNLLQKHRLWESYLSGLGIPDDHLHRPADEIEHFIDEELKQRLAEKLDYPDTDPHGKAIPRKK